MNQLARIDLIYEQEELYTREEIITAIRRIVAEGAVDVAQAEPEPFLWVCLVDDDVEPRIRAWTTHRKRAEKFKLDGLDMVPLYASPMSSTQNSPPVELAPQNSAERIPSSDAGSAGGETVSSTQSGDAAK